MRIKRKTFTGKCDQGRICPHPIGYTVLANTVMLTRAVSFHQLLDARLNVVIPVRLTEGAADDAVHLHVNGVPLGGPVQGDEQHPLTPLLY